MAPYQAGHIVMITIVARDAQFLVVFGHQVSFLDVEVFCQPHERVGHPCLCVKLLPFFGKPGFLLLLCKLLFAFFILISPVATEKSANENSATPQDIILGIEDICGLGACASIAM